jgi:hypothetical protein
MITALSIGRGGLGRFANQAFTIAGCIGIAIKSGQPYGFPRWKTYDNALFGEPVDDIEDHLVNELPRSDGLEFQDYGYFWGYRDIFLPQGNFSIDAHMQSWKFTDHCMPQIREVFRFKDEDYQNDFIAVHYRCGDYLSDPTAQHPRCSPEYYKEAMKLFPGEKFVLFTDDKKAAFEMFGESVSYSGEVDYINDFAFMKRCKSFIIANSSFSYFAALLGEHPDKKIVMPSRWFGSSMPPEFDTNDIYPPEAIVI